MAKPKLYDQESVLRYTAELGRRVDKWRKNKLAPSGKPISRTEAFRRLIDRGLKAKGKE